VDLEAMIERVCRYSVGGCSGVNLEAGSNGVSL